MCDAIAEGGRRCPSCHAERRSARDRARYAARRAAAADGGGAGQDTLQEYSPPLGEVLTSGQISDRVQEIQGLLLEGDPRAHEQLAAWAGSPLQAISRVGAAIANEAELDAGIAAREMSQDLEQRVDSARSRILDIYDVLNVEVAEVREASRELAWRQGQKRLVDASDGRITIGGLHDEIQRARARLSAAEDRLREAGEPYRLEALHHEHSLLVEAEDDQTQGELAVLAISYRTSLGDHVALGFSRDLPWDPDSHPAAIRMLEAASRCFPASWTRAAGGGYPVRATLTTGRGSYRDAVVTPKFLRTVSLPAGLTPPDSGLTAFVEGVSPGEDGEVIWHEIEMEFHEESDGTLTVSPEPPAGTDWTPHGMLVGGHLWRRPATRLAEPPRIEATEGAGHFRASVHELAHRFESLVPQLGIAQEAFVRRRTMMPGGGQQEPVAMYPGQTPVELVRPDKFVTAYIGRDYGSGTHHEVLDRSGGALRGAVRRPSGRP